ncbi:long-chain-fatty-acid--CoA ligase [Bacillus sp. B15-48]|uniref:long-chain-fatty-acid--CoA ligase n=1 Tax=Bacillus sp. B15-48 TaxID=1548601 RepID=UPI00193F795C|nr:long-chain-fatty-acid--CoA ligase [Bacillus sp. B15-48]MBM4763325.1 long-chain-fatty-acid--CoA ligase [Bacillus sp. B15-48]
MFLIGDILPMAARKYPNNISVVSEEARFTFKKSNERMLRLANSLLKLGIQKGDRIAIMQTNGYQYLETMLACAHIGAVFVSINYRLRPDEIEYLINDSGATVFFVGKRYVPIIDSIRTKIPHVKTYICFEQSSVSMLDYEDLVKQGIPKEVRVEGLDSHSILKIQYSSGTTGFPKGAMITHEAAMARLTSNVFNLLKPGDKLYSAGTMFHIAGFGYNFTAWINGATVYTLKQFEKKTVADLIEKEKLTCCFLVPSMLNFILNLPDIDRYDLSSLKYIGYGSAPMPLSLLKKSMDKFDCQFFNMFGASETGTTTCLIPEDHKISGSTQELSRLNSVGKALPYTDIRVVNEDGEDIAPGEVGEIIIKSATNMIGYWNKPEETAETVIDGWLHIGDMVTVDEDGYYYVVDRKKDMIIRGGENIYPVEIENVLYQHPAILEASVFGTPDEAWGENVKAVVVLKPDCVIDSAELIAYCKTKLASYKCPASVEFTDQLPRNGMGKVLKRELREQYRSVIR